MGTIIGILLLAVIIRIGAELFIKGLSAISEKSVGGCLVGLFAILFGIAFFKWAATAPISFIVVAVIIAAIAKGSIFDS